MPGDHVMRHFWFASKREALFTLLIDGAVCPLIAAAGAVTGSLSTGAGRARMAGLVASRLRGLAHRLSPEQLSLPNR